MRRSCASAGGGCNTGRRGAGKALRRTDARRWIPLDQLRDRLDEVDQQRQVMTVCRSGNHGFLMAGFLSDRGYAVENLEGGIQKWANRGPPVRTPGAGLRRAA
jgi:rhodanese-related sulfurtransferase